MSRKPKLIAIGISTGGPQTLSTLFPQLEPDLPPIIVVQHIPPGFEKSLADRLDMYSPINVKVAEHGEILRPGSAYIAKGDKHLEVARKGNEIRLKTTDGKRITGHKPSVNVLFESIAREGIFCAAILMTGLGADGAKGLLKLKEKGCLTAAQDKNTSVVFGMPQAAIRNGAAEEVLSLEEIPSWLNAFSVRALLKKS